MARQKLNETELQSHLKQLTGWTVKDGKLHRQYTFPDFAHAMGFMVTAAMTIEKMNHHPEWQNVYNRVTVDLTTHDAGGITANDVELAEVLNRVAGKSV